MAVKKNGPNSKGDPTAIESDAHGVADPEPAAALEEASAAIIEPAITDTVDVNHESVDADPREGTTAAAQNAIDWTTRSGCVPTTLTSPATASIRPSTAGPTTDAAGPRHPTCCRTPADPSAVSGQQNR